MNYPDNNRDNIFVLVRVRPLSEKEAREGDEVCVRVDEKRQNTIILDTKPEPKLFSFDWVASRSTTQEEIFNSVGKKQVDVCLQGYNCTIFAYGQTGAGKTYTMMGRGLDDELAPDFQHRGIQPRVLEYLFENLNLIKAQDKDVEALVKASYFEIYNEQIMDLLNPTSGNLQVREDLRRGIFLEGIAEEAIMNSAEALSILKKGGKNRHIASTEVNFESSRSHSVLTLTIEIKKGSDGVLNLTTSKFHFVDLAGSERQKLTRTSGQRLKEAGNIHKSLSVLGSVINSLSEGKNAHVRYRDSKLTFILKDSIGGNSRTAMIANISPSASSFSETLSTLKFAQRAKLIKNRASINHEASGSVDNLRREINRLKDELANARNLISTLEDNERFKIRQASVSKSLSELEATENREEADSFTRQLLKANKKELEIEVLLRESMNIMYETERHLQAEIERKDEFLSMFDSLCELHKDNDSKLKPLMDLYEKKVSAQLSDCVDEQTRAVVEENTILREIAKNAPLIMQVFEENLILKEKLRELEVDDLNSSDYNIREKLELNMVFLTEVSRKIDDSIKKREFLDQRLERMAFMLGISPIDLAKSPISDSDIEELKTKIEALNFELLKEKQEKENLEAENSIFRNQLNKKSEEIIMLEQDKENTLHSYEKRIKEIKERISEPQPTLNASLEHEMIELRDQMEVWKKKCEDLENQMKYMENQHNIALDQKQDSLKFNQARVTELTQENSKLASKVQVLESKSKQSLEDRENWTCEKLALTAKITELLNKQGTIEANLQAALHDKYQLQNDMEDIKKNQTNRKDLDEVKKEISLLQTEVQREKLEKEKIQDELENMQESYSYVLDNLARFNRADKSSELFEVETNDGRRSFSQSQTDSKASTRNPRSIVSEIKSVLDCERDEKNKLKTQMNSLSLSIQTLKEEENQKRQEFEGLKELLAQNSHRLNEAESRLASKNKDYQDLEERYQQIIEQQKQTKQEIMELRIAIQKKEAEEKNAQIKRREDQEKIVSLQEQLSEKMDEYHRLNLQFKELEAEVFKLKKNLDISEKKIESLNNELRLSLNSKTLLEQKIKELNLKHSLLEFQDANSQPQRSPNKSFEPDAHSPLSAPIIGKSSLQQQESQKVLQDMQRFFREEEVENNKLKEKLSRLECQLKDYENQLSFSKQELDKAHSEVRRLSLTDFDPENLIKSKDQKIEQLEKEIADLKKSAVLSKWITQDVVSEERSIQTVEETDGITAEKHTEYLRSEISRLKEENCLLTNRLFTVSRKYNGISAQIGTIATKYNEDISNIKEPSKQDQIIMAMELQRKTTENKYLIEIIKRFQSVIITSKLISDSKVIKSLNEFGRASLEKTTAVFEILVNKIVEKEALIAAREFKLDATKLHYSLMQKEISLLKKKNEIFDTLSDGKCSIVSKDSHILEKENFRINQLQDSKKRRSTSGKPSVEKLSNKSIPEHRSDKWHSHKQSKWPKEALGKRDPNEVRSENLQELDEVKSNAIMSQKIIQIDGVDETKPMRSAEKSLLLHQDLQKVVTDLQKFSKNKKHFGDKKEKQPIEKKKRGKPLLKETAFERKVSKEKEDQPQKKIKSSKI